MPHRGLITLPPTRADLAVAKAVARRARPAPERTFRIITWLADEKVLLGAVAAFWVYARSTRHSRDVTREADRMLCSLAVAGALPHLFKRLIDRKRPDRTVVHGRRHGIPRSGDAWDSFPSGHALHLGAIAGPALRLAPSELRPLVGATLAGLAATRILLLAHYPSDVAAGWGLGLLLDRLVGDCLRAFRIGKDRRDGVERNDATSQSGSSSPNRSTRA